MRERRKRPGESDTGMQQVTWRRLAALSVGVGGEKGNPAISSSLGTGSLKPAYFCSQAESTPSLPNISPVTNSYSLPTDSPVRARPHNTLPF